MEDTLTKLNGATYQYKYKIYNGTGQEFSFKDSAVQNLLYEESLFDPFPDGAITIANPSNFIDSKFIFRGDGSDKIDIFLRDEANNVEINSTFTIIGEKNIVNDSTPIKNIKVFYFIDNHESMLLHKFPYGRAYSGKAGKIIKDILKEFKFEIKTDDADEEIFEDGDFILTSTDPFVPSVNYRYIDVIYYLLQYYYFKDGNTPVKGILSKERDGKYSLKTISKDYFEKNSELLIEAFHSGEILTKQDIPIGSEDNPDTPLDTPSDRNISNVTSISLDKYSVDDSNQFFMNTNVISYDNILGINYIDQLRIKDVRTEWEEKFVKKFPMSYGEPVRHLPMTKEKLEGEFKTYRLPYSRVDNVNIVKANMINDFIFRNNQIMITTNGNLARQPGTFIDISLQKKEAKSPLLLGRWFVTGVEHIKLGSTYRNTIKAVKTFAGPSYKTGNNDQDV
jgi:hypothetical protein